MFIRGLQEALWKEQHSDEEQVPPYEQLNIRFFVEGREVDFARNSIAAAARASEMHSDVISIRHPTEEGVLGWLLLTYQVLCRCNTALKLSGLGLCCIAVLAMTIQHISLECAPGLQHLKR